MRYAAIRKMDISNGEGLGVSLFVQGCDFHCKNCFNKETWNFNGGKEFTINEALKLLSQLWKPHYTRLSILGGEPLHANNLISVTMLCKFVKEFKPEKNIWVYTGFKMEDEISLLNRDLDLFNYIDVIVDGRYIDEKKDLSYPWAGSTNQRVIDVHKSLAQNKIVLWRSNL